ncbi:MAG: DUF1080 domain-containing protein [Cytophagales bacterium]|nr:MAG: DUF1080 domain-containing protein [Cytophagales bacterium]
MNYKILIIKLLILLFAFSTFAQEFNTLSKEEKKNGWKLLFDGKTLNGWRNYLKKDVSPKWKIEDNALFISEGGAGNLLTKKQYENFELSVEWKLAKGGNSGIMYRVWEDPLYSQPYFTGIEMQVLDDAGHPDAMRGEQGTHRAGALYDMLPPTDFSAVKPVGEWNTARLIVNNNHAEHWLNGKKIVEYDLSGEMWDRLVSDSKFNGWYDFAKHPKGHIALQDHGDKVWFRNLKIRELKGKKAGKTKIERNIPVIDSLTLANYTGVYELDKNSYGLQTITVTTKDNKLFAQINKTPANELLPLAEKHRFLILSSGITLIFKPEENKKVNQLIFWVGKTSQLAGKKAE